MVMVMVMMLVVVVPVASSGPCRREPRRVKLSSTHNTLAMTNMVMVRTLMMSSPRSISTMSMLACEQDGTGGHYIRQHYPCNSIL